MSSFSYIVVMIGSCLVAAWLGLIWLFNGFGGSPKSSEGYLAGIGVLVAVGLAAYCVVKLAKTEDKK